MKAFFEFYKKYLNNNKDEFDFDTNKIYLQSYFKKSNLKYLFYFTKQLNINNFEIGYYFKK